MFCGGYGIRTPLNPCKGFVLAITLYPPDIITLYRLSPQPDSNQQPSDYKSDSLPIKDIGAKIKMYQDQPIPTFCQYLFELLIKEVAMTGV